MTEAQLELMWDKYVVWDRAARQGNMELRDYNRRCADALKQLLAEQSEFGPLTFPGPNSALEPPDPQVSHPFRADLKSNLGELVTALEECRPRCRAGTPHRCDRLGGNYAGATDPCCRTRAIIAHFRGGVSG